MAKGTKGTGKSSNINVVIKKKIPPQVPTKDAQGTKTQPVKGNTSGRSAYTGK